LVLALGLGACSDDNGGSSDTTQDETTGDPSQEDTAPDISVDDVPPDLPAEPDVVEDPSPDPDATDTPTEEAPPGEGVVGDACESAADCGAYPATAVQCMTDLMGFITFQGGYCTASCTSAAECGDGANCVNLMIVSYCLKLCDSNSDCRMSEDYECGELPYVGDGNTYCIPRFDVPEMDF